MSKSDERFGDLEILVTRRALQLPPDSLYFTCHGSTDEMEGKFLAIFLCCDWGDFGMSPRSVFFILGTFCVIFLQAFFSSKTLNPFVKDVSR